MSQARPRLGSRDVIIVSGGLFVASILGLTFLASVARWLTPEDNARFLSLWGLFFGLGAIMVAAEQDSARAATKARLRGEQPPFEAAQIALVTAVGITLTLAVLLLAAPHLLPRDATATVLALGLGAFAFQLPIRGLLVGAGRTTALTLVTGLEAVLRLLTLGLVVAAISGPSLLGAVVALAAGSLAFVPFARLALRGMRAGSGRRPWREVVRAVGGLAAGNALLAVLLTGFPAVITLIAQEPATPALASLFGAITMSRLPLVALAPLQSLAVPHATELIGLGRHDDLRRWVFRGALGGLSVAASAGGLGWYVGPALLSVFMGPGYSIGALPMAILFAGAVLLGLALLQVAVCVALRRYRLPSAIWGVACVAAAVVIRWGPEAIGLRGALALGVAGAVAYATSALAVVRFASTPFAEPVASVGVRVDEAGGESASENQTNADATSANDKTPSTQKEPGPGSPPHHHE